MIAFVHSASHAPATPGAYVLWVRLDKLSRVNLGDRRSLLYEGDYLYCGSAKGPGGLRARLARHMRRDKRAHWHIDQLTAAGALRGAWIEEGGDECALNALLDALPVPTPGFGSSDCRRCVSHLRRIEDPATLPEAMRQAIQAAQDPGARRAFRLLRIPEFDDDLSVDCWVRIMCDYSAEGVWSRAGVSSGVEDLPVDAALQARILQWQSIYDAHDDEEGAMSNLEAFCAEGRAIAEAVKRQLPEWTVVYHDEAKFQAYLKAKLDYLTGRRPARDYEHEILLPET